MGAPGFTRLRIGTAGRCRELAEMAVVAFILVDLSLYHERVRVPLFITGSVGIVAHNAVGFPRGLYRFSSSGGQLLVDEMGIFGRMALSAFLPLVVGMGADLVRITPALVPVVDGVEVSIVLADGETSRVFVGSNAYPFLGDVVGPMALPAEVLSAVIGIEVEVMGIAVRIRGDIRAVHGPPVQVGPVRPVWVGISRIKGCPAVPGCEINPVAVF